MRKLVYLLAAVVTVMVSCGPSYEEQQKQTRLQRRQKMREDSAALKVAVVPTIDCLPLLVASHDGLFQQSGADVRLKLFTAQMDCDTAIAGGSVEGCVTDLVRAERLIQKGTPLRYVTTTAAYWQLYSNRMARIRNLQQLDDRMVGMTRFSATDLIADRLRDSAKIDRERYFKIQLNDVHVRLKMLLNQEIDAVLLAEPQATEARLAGHRLLADSRQFAPWLGVIAFREKDMQDSTRQRQIEAFKRGYNMACDSIKHYGLNHYRELLVKYFKMKDNHVDSLPSPLPFQHIAEPQEADIEKARNWLKQQ